MPGTNADGLQFVSDAIKRGAVAVIAERQPQEPIPGIAFLIVDDVRRVLARAAALLAGRQPETIAAVTGTSGKTSVAAFCRQIWQTLGYPAASIGTIGLVTPSGETYGSLTTPDPVSLAETLAGLAQDGVTHVAMEASSHGIEQRRLDGIALKAAGFTNLSRDHLDYHKTPEAYLAAKLRLFDTLLPDGAAAVVNADSDVAERVIAVCHARKLEVIDVGQRGRRLRLVASRMDERGADIEVEVDGQRFATHLPLPGEFQIANALLAAGLCLATGESARAVIPALAHLSGAPGRLELVGRRAGAPVFVDYAHKPDALEKVLTTLRALTRNRLSVVFGCGGDRDTGKRPIMGEIAARLADRVIVTDDNPRSESPATIRAAILAGAEKGSAEVTEIADRGTAILAAVGSLEEGDVLVIAGKGHETGQIVGDKVFPFSDLDVARRALHNLPA